MAASAAALLATDGVNLTVARGLVAVDGFAFFFNVLFILAAALTVAMSPRYLAVEGVRPGEYYFLVLSATLGMMFMAGGIDLITIFVGLETMAVSFYILAGYIRPSRRSNEAALKYFVLGAFSLAILLYGMSLLYGLTGSTHLRTIATALVTGGGRAAAAARGDPACRRDRLQNRGGAVPHVGARTCTKARRRRSPRSCRLDPRPRRSPCCCASSSRACRPSGWAAWGGCAGSRSGGASFFYVLAIVTMTAGNIAALTQGNIKRMLAYSSIAHGGYVLVGIVAGHHARHQLPRWSTWWPTRSCSSARLRSSRRCAGGDERGDELKDFRGLSATNPGAAFAMLIFMLSLGGIPPTAGFMGKLWLFGSAIDAGYIGLAVVGVLNSALSLYYYVRVVVFMWADDPDAVRSPMVLSPGAGRGPRRDRRRHDRGGRRPGAPLRARPGLRGDARRGADARATIAHGRPTAAQDEHPGGNRSHARPTHLGGHLVRARDRDGGRYRAGARPVAGYQPVGASWSSSPLVSPPGILNVYRAFGKS